MAFTWQNMATAIVLTFFCIIPFTTGLYFHIGETERKCFIEEIPDETMVTGKEIRILTFIKSLIVNNIFFIEPLLTYIPFPILLMTSSIIINNYQIVCNYL